MGSIRRWSMVRLLRSSSGGGGSAQRTGLQILPAWVDYFNHPSGKILGTNHDVATFETNVYSQTFSGLISATQVIGSIAVRIFLAVLSCFSDSFRYSFRHYH